MRSDIHVSGVRLVSAPPHDAQRGLVGWTSFLLGGRVRLYGVALRRTRAGRLVLSFPERKDDGGRSHPLVRPIDDATRREIERQVFEALGLLEEVDQ